MCTKILLADDEYLEREALKIIIHEGMKDVIIAGEASSGREVIALHEEHKPHIILMDIKMPGIDGIRATELIKRENPYIVIIIITAYDEFALAQKAIKAGADDYILKPARPEEILAAVDKYRNKSKQGIFSKGVEEETAAFELLRRGDYHGFKKALNEILAHSAGEVESIDAQRTKIIQMVTEVFKVAHEFCNKPEKLINLQFHSTYELGHQKNIGTMIQWFNNLLEKIYDTVFRENETNLNRELEIILHYIEKNFHKGITLEDVAKHVGLSPFYLSKLFKKQVGINFIEYVTKKKIDKAKDLLVQTNLPVINIALELGFHEPNYFSKVFKKVEGITPSQYRDRIS
ncbi:two-component system, response regulator YesN [Geosporobacter subterraneus DSM 17957]|uniref:Stage 0 sporulation protein A homolog n=1 Tax=Geosporobacter subterraneus DSM 17957 TaxID=1121919 RepID=A0A1M6K0V0_9FIRM|nr:response regulator [Geosporobacter subterraneus]SHJ52538.1 two-component system, response regulator YesN [Geosporobacter subterraneus DSM 17957]